jgi:hypothetical protein
MDWKDEVYRAVYVCGEVAVGAVYPPRGRGQAWRWRIWQTVSGHAHEGRDSSEQKTRKQVEVRFAAFLRAAGLRAEGGAL